jgi:hypothetical protein
MTSGKRHRATLVALAVASIALAPAAVLASQGPGTSAGTASSITQFAMVYGMSALVVGAGLIGALRKPGPGR